MTDTPLLLVHGTDDELIPVSHAERLATAYPGDPDVWIVDGTRHTETIHRKPVEYAQKLKVFLERINGPVPKDHNDGH